MRSVEKAGFVHRHVLDRGPEMDAFTAILTQFQESAQTIGDWLVAEYHVILPYRSKVSTPGFRLKGLRQIQVGDDFGVESNLYRQFRDYGQALFISALFGLALGS
jgi:hypothetical protein